MTKKIDYKAKVKELTTTNLQQAGTIGKLREDISQQTATLNTLLEQSQTIKDIKDRLDSLECDIDYKANSDDIEESVDEDKVEELIDDAISNLTISR
jgi:hypothetical protein